VSEADVTRMLHEAAAGRRGAVDRLVPLVYDELRRLAQSHLSRERPDHTLPATALVHEAYLKLVDQTRATWVDRAHFFALASQAIRRILVDHARGRGRARRGGGTPRLPLEAADRVAAELPHPDLVALDRALARLAQVHPEKARVVELRFFGGLAVDEIAEVLGFSRSTAERAWRFARAWLYRELVERGEGP